MSSDADGFTTGVKSADAASGPAAGSEAVFRRKVCFSLAPADVAFDAGATQKPKSFSSLRYDSWAGIQTLSSRLAEIGSRDIQLSHVVVTGNASQPSEKSERIGVPL